MKNIKKELQAVNKELKALVKKTDNLIKAVGKTGKPGIVRSKAVKKKYKRKTIAVKKGTKKADIVKVVSHQQALSQSRKYLRNNPPKAQKIGFS